MVFSIFSITLAHPHPMHHQSGLGKFLQNWFHEFLHPVADLLNEKCWKKCLCPQSTAREALPPKKEKKLNILAKMALQESWLNPKGRLY